MEIEPEYEEDGKPWLDVEQSPEKGRPVWVQFKTGWRPCFLADAYEMSDAFWFAEVSGWKYYQHPNYQPERVISPEEFEEGEG